MYSSRNELHSEMKWVQKPLENHHMVLDEDPHAAEGPNASHMQNLPLSRKSNSSPLLRILQMATGGHFSLTRLNENKVNNLEPFSEQNPGLAQTFPYASDRALFTSRPRSSSLGCAHVRDGLSPSFRTDSLSPHPKLLEIIIPNMQHACLELLFLQT